MTIKKKPKQHDKSALVVHSEKGKSEQRQLAEVKLSPNILNTLTTETYAKSVMGEIDFTEAVAVMEEKTAKVVAGDLSELESTLAAQVVSLNAIFTTLARRAMNCEYVNQVETNLRLSLKAQAQCARTVEVLAAIKNPPIVYAKQANIAAGHQQINNGNQSISHAHPRKTKNSANELLSEDSHEAMDTGRTIEASRIDKELATVETFDRR